MQKPDCTTFPETSPPQLNARLLSSWHPPGYAGRGRVQLAHLCTTLKLATTLSVRPAHICFSPCSLLSEHPSNE